MYGVRLPIHLVNITKENTVGLDVQFNKTKAVEVGLVLRDRANGTTEDIAIAVKNESSPNYIAWLKEVETVMEVPNRDGINIHADIHEDTITVRANKWGLTYIPLTDWLREHSITWEEY